VSLLLHAITCPPEARAVHARGLRGAPLTRLDISGLSAWSTAHNVSPFSRDDVLDNHRVVSGIFGSVDACLPARFPTVLDASQLDALIRERRDALLRQLDVVRGGCELAITVIWSSPDGPLPIPEDIAPGRRYLLARRQTITASERRRARAMVLADDLQRELASAQRDARREICPSPRVALSYAVLLSLTDVETVKQRIPRGATDVRILVNGPWPPYTFASVRPEEPRSE
jgi:hypothetical protein